MISSPAPVRTTPTAGDAPVSQGRLRLETVETESAFAALEPLWNELLSRSGTASPTLTWAWLWSWWEIFGRKCPKSGQCGKPYVLVVFDGAKPVGIFPFISHACGWRFLRVRRLRPMGYNGGLEPTGLTEEPLVVTLEGYEERVRIAAIDHVAQGLAVGKWDCAIVRQLEVDPQRPFGPKRLGAHLSSKLKAGPQIVHLPGTWAEFRKQLSKSMRDNLPYYPRLLKRAGHEFGVREIREPVEMASAVARLVRLHRKRVWSDIGEAHNDYFPCAVQEEVMLRGFERLAAEGKGFIAELEVDGSLVASQAFVESGAEMLVFYSGFDPDWAKFSPLLVLQSEVFQGAIQRGVRRLNLLFGNAQWQKRWGAEPERREMRALLVSVWPMALVRCALYALARETTALVRRHGVSRWFKQRRQRAART